MKLKIFTCILVSVMLSATTAWAELTKTEVSQLYVSVFNRASEGEGNAYWQSQPDMATAATAMLDTDAARDYFGANLNTNQAFIEHIYLNTLNKTIVDDFDGISYWVGLLGAGTSRGEAVADLVGVIKDYAPGGPYYDPDDAATVAAYNQFTNRVTVSNYMTDAVYNTPADWETSTAFSSGLIVTDDPATVDMAKTAVNRFVGGTDPSGPCGAYVAPGVWKEFDCYNLAAIGKTTSDNPFTPSWRLIGGYWQWGRKGPSSSQWHDTNTPNFAHGPIGPGPYETNDGAISGWDEANAPNGSWSDTVKTVSDPCPEGFRVPTKTQLEGIINNNIQNIAGSWLEGPDNPTNYSSACFFGNNLMMPVAGYRDSSNGSLVYRGHSSSYWSSTGPEERCHIPWDNLNTVVCEYESSDAYSLLISQSSASMVRADSRNWGSSVRCIALSDDSAPCIFNLSSTSGSFAATGGNHSVEISVSPSNYGWRIFNDLSWVSLSLDRGIGSGTVVITVGNNDGLARYGSVTIAGQTFTISQDAGGSATPCGAYIAPGVWKEFDCYNLAAIGKTTNDDPFTPSWRLIGGYWQWGRKGPSSSQWYNTNTTNFAHGPTGPSTEEANEGAISGWDSSYAPDGSWSDAPKTANDPCPSGYRVPTQTQWEGVINNNTQGAIGTWSTFYSEDHTNYSNARFFGDDLMLPAAGNRRYSSGALSSRGHYGYYWSSTQYSSSYAGGLYFYSSVAGAVNYYRSYGGSVRCVAE